MITKETVFVIGAGASNPYGFPLGFGLKKLVMERYKEGTGDAALHLYSNTDFDKDAATEFISALRYSGLSSVDAFLERRPQFLDIGKATMGIELLMKEAALFFSLRRGQVGRLSMS